DSVCRTLFCPIRSVQRGQSHGVRESPGCRTVSRVAHAPLVLEATVRFAIVDEQSASALAWEQRNQGICGEARAAYRWERWRDEPRWGHSCFRLLVVFCMTLATQVSSSRPPLTQADATVVCLVPVRTHTR